MALGRPGYVRPMSASSRPVPPARLRAANVARGALGAVALARPRTMAGVYGADPSARPAVVAARVLGGRHLTEAAVLEASPTVRTRMVAAAVDLTHASSMVLLAVVSRRWRRPALVSASVAVACAAATYPLPTAADLDRRESRPIAGRDPVARPERVGRAVDDEEDDEGDDEGDDDEDDGPSAEQMGRRVRSRSAAADDRRRRLLERSMATHRPFARAAAVLLAAMAVWLLVGQWVLNYPLNGPAQNAALRETGFAVVVALCGLRLVVVRRSPVATGVAVLCGVLLLVSGPLLGRTWRPAEADEVASGVLVLVLGLLTWPRRGASGDAAQA